MKYGESLAYLLTFQANLEESERKKLRRERNKVAASKCRNKRKEHVRYLMKVYFLSVSPSSMSLENHVKTVWVSFEESHLTLCQQHQWYVIFIYGGLYFFKEITELKFLDSVHEKHVQLLALRRSLKECKKPQGVYLVVKLVYH